MGDLRLKIRNKIYTAGNHIVDIKNNNNAVVVFIGKMSHDTLKPYIDNFLVDTLKSQISANKITFVQIEKDEIKDMPRKLAEAVKKIEFNPIMKNELFISFVTIMDDDIYEVEHDIDVSEIEKLKASALGGYAVEVFYDFYGLFTSSAKYLNRMNAKKTILNFLKDENGGSYIRKRIYHQACPGNDYYRSAKSITFMLLVNLIEKIDQHTVTNSVVEGENYTWTTFAFFEKNLAALVICEMINKLLENQVKEVETVSLESISQIVKDVLNQEEKEMKKLASISDINYIPVLVRRVERQLSFSEKALNLVKKDKISPIELRKENEEVSINDLLKQQKKLMDDYVEETITDSYIDRLILSLIKQCTVMSSINSHQNDALVYKSLLMIRDELLTKDKNGSYGEDFYERRYKENLNEAKAKIMEKIIAYYNANINSYVEKVQSHWNKMNMEVNNLIKDFGTFQSYFDGMSDLISDKAINLMCTYDDILDKINVESVVQAINKNTDIYSNILSSYFDDVEEAGEIARKFGNQNIVPNMEDITYYLFSATPVKCPDGLKNTHDSHWFRELEIAILFTAKNKMDDCKNLPFSV